MKTLLQGAYVLVDHTLKQLDVSVENGQIIEVSHDLPPQTFDTVIKLHHLLLLPGLVDVHVHLREPGFLYKETVKTGTMSAAAGGFTQVFSMPNLDPPPDSAEHLAVQLAAIRKDARVSVLPYGTLTVGQKGGGALTPYDEIIGGVAGFSDDGRGVQSDELMRAAMKRIAALGGIVVAHCEDERYLNGGVIHDGEFAASSGLPGISSKSEWAQVERDLELVRETGCRYHVCHVSTKESVRLIRKAKAEGLPVTCETAPHYLVFTDADLQDDGRFKMNPPIRGREDRHALIEGMLDGTIDVIATDHAPHSMEEKGKGLRCSVMGIVGLETAFPVMYTNFVKNGVMPLVRLQELMCENPRAIFRQPHVSVAPGQVADLAAFDIENPWIVDVAAFHSMGRASPFSGMELYGKCAFTMLGGKTVWSENSANTTRN